MRHKYTIITYYSNITGYIFITCRPNTEGKWRGGLIDVGDGKQIGAGWAWPGQATCNFWLRPCKTLALRALRTLRS